MRNVFFDVLEVNIAISILILALSLFAGKLRKRYGAGWMKAVWIFLAVRLLIPYNFSLPFTEIRFLNIPGFEQEDSGYRKGFLFGNTGENAENLVRNSIQDLNVIQDGNGVQVKDHMQEINANGEGYHYAGNSGTGDMISTNTDHKESEGISGINGFSYSGLLTMIWMIGICFCGVYLLLGYLLFLRKYGRNFYPIADKDLEKRINDVQKKLIGSVSIPVFQSRNIASPMLTGMIRPRLILPVSKKEWTKTELELMMAHELCHYKKKDLFWKLFMSAAWCVNWFNPMVMLLKKQFFYDMELACDGAVLSERDGKEQEIYARMMLSFAGNRNGMQEFSTGFWEDRKRMRKRIDYMFYGKEKKNGIFGIVVAGALILSAGLLVSCGYKEKETEKLLNVKEVEEEQWEAARQETDFAVSVDYEEGEEHIILSELSDKSVLNEIPVTKDQGMVFINMINENSGYLLYCGSPAAGLMNKTLYATNDRWTTYSEIDISSKIDGYPNSLSAVSEDKIYIGTQMRSNGYLFASKDQGESFEAVWAEDETYFRYGYAPLFDKESKRAYLILEAENEYFVYQAEYPAADGKDSWNLAWKCVGKFRLEDYGTIEEYFLYEGQIYLVNLQGKRCQIALE